MVTSMVMWNQNLVKTIDTSLFFLKRNATYESASIDITEDYRAETHTRQRTLVLFPKLKT